MFAGVPFGLTPTSSLLQRVMTKLFEGPKSTRPFADDTPVGSRNDESHLEYVIETINRLTSVNFRLRIAKCEFFRPALHALWHTLSAKGITIDRRKLEDVLQWPRPSSGKHIERFLGLINYFRDFVPCYARLAAPLEELRRQPVIDTTIWSPRCEQAFGAILDVLAHDVFRYFPDFENILPGR